MKADWHQVNLVCRTLFGSQNKLTYSPLVKELTSRIGKRSPVSKLLMIIDVTSCSPKIKAEIKKFK